MGSIAVTTGSVRARDCPEVKSILEALDGLAEGMDERRVERGKANRRKFGPGVLEVESCFAEQHPWFLLRRHWRQGEKSWTRAPRAL